MTDDVVAMDRQELQDLLLHSDDISAFLEDFTAMLAREISDGDAPAWCAVTLLRKRKASTAAASGLEAQALDELQNSFTDGPCMTAIREDTVIRVGDVCARTRGGRTISPRPRNRACAPSSASLSTWTTMPGPA